MIGSFLTNVAIAGISVVTGILLARLLGPHGRGQLAAIQALPMIVGGLGQLGTYEAMIYLGSRDRSRVGSYVISSTALGLVAAIPIVLVAQQLVPWFLEAQAPQVIAASQLYMLLLFANVLHAVAPGAARAVHRIGQWNLLRLLAPLTWGVVVLALWTLGVGDPATVAGTHLVSYFLLTLLMLFAARDVLRGADWPRVSLWPRILRYGLPIAGGATPQFLNERLDQLLIAALLAPTQLGYYAVATSWSGLGLVPAMAFASVAFSKLAGMKTLQEQQRFLARATPAVVAVSAVTVLALAAATPLAIGRVFGVEFLDAIPVAWILLGSVLLRAVALMLQVALQALGRPGVAMLGQWAGLAALVPALALLLPRWGVSGAAWALVVASGVSLATVTAALLRGLRPGAPGGDAAVAT